MLPLEQIRINELWEHDFLTQHSKEAVRKHGGQKQEAQESMACVDTSLQKCKGIRNLWNIVLCISFLNSKEKEAEAHAGNLHCTGMRV